MENINIREKVKLMLLRRNITLTELAKRMTELTGEKYSQSGLSQKLTRESLKYSEMELICKILGFQIKIEMN